MTTLHRLLSDLTPLLDSERGQRVILAGDLNAGTQPWQGEKYDSWSLNLWQRFLEFGFTDCLPAMVAPDRGGLHGCACGGGPECRHTLTSRVSRPNARPWENYHILTMPGVKATACFALNAPDSTTWTYSDPVP
jgi:hypothetical protein